MGGLVARPELVRKINRAFGARYIRESAAIVAKLPKSADFLDISVALGLLDHIHYTSLKKYRDSLTIPPLAQDILTATYRYSLFHKPAPVPMHMDIEVGRNAGVSVTAKDKLIEVLLTRPDPKPLARSKAARQ
jgi:hypothetical protein